MSGAIRIAPPPGEMVAGITDIERYIYDDIDAENYSGVKGYEIPEKARWRELHPLAADNDILKFGRQYHLLSLKKAEFDENYYEDAKPPHGGGHLVDTSKRNKLNPTTKEEAAENREWKGQQAKLHKGQEALEPDDWRLLHQMRDTLYAHPLTASIMNFPGSLREVTCLSQFPDGMWTKSQFDVVLDTKGGEAAMLFGRDDVEDGTWIGDLKSCRDASMNKFQWSVRDFKYEGQGSFYVDNYERATGIKPAGFFFIAQEKSGMCSPCVYLMGSSHFERGRRYYLDMIVKKQECKRTDTYPGYAQSALYLPGDF